MIYAGPQELTKTFFFLFFLFLPVICDVKKILLIIYCVSSAPSGCMPARLSLGVMAFLGFVMMTSVRINLSVAIVAMVRQNASNAAQAETECRGNESLTMLRQDGRGNQDADAYAQRTKDTEMGRSGNVYKHH
ncbi:hypothetical protein GWK47_017704 [Chionoecetes opilio]|uniref:Uncharacterized protein n=1 Tax=Chionoecetes opilio TaxID=41210 RepID=A0A8J4XSF7_CHIOP|nr:hypothetical protein GWK47_017704 [Chionoecetes opilio]